MEGLEMGPVIDINDFLPDKGVWLLWDSFTRDSLHAIFPQGQEIAALRKVNEQGYGWAEFVEWGDLG